MYTRLIEKTLQDLFPSPEILVVYGPRRAGKTTLLHQVQARLHPQQPSALYSLDDPTAQAIFDQPSTARLSRIFTELGFTLEKRSVLLLDEIQGFERVDLLLKLIYDHFPHVKVIATSSSSLLLLNHLTDSLAGRKYFIELLPLTLAEYTGIPIEDFFSFPEHITRQGELSQIVQSFMVYGSYPEVVARSGGMEKESKLRDIVESVLYKDIFLMENIKAPQALVKLVALLAYQIGNLVNVNELAAQLGISRNTVEQYISILEKYFLIFRLPPFERNLRSEINSKQKVYFWDTGVRNAVINRFAPLETREDRGALFENQVIASILKRNLYARRPYNAYFWRTYQGYEIDLVLEDVHSQELWAFQMTLGGRAPFSNAFDTYTPVRKMIVCPENAYRFCW
ncbi:MAG: ATP-binding protein [Anaerolineae bacterium]|nr:ATP-binding protein [Anaerolineae bacterium]